MAGSAVASGDGLLIALVFAALVLVALTAWLGVALLRRCIADYDSQGPRTR